MPRGRRRRRIPGPPGDGLARLPGPWREQDVELASRNEVADDDRTGHVGDDLGNVVGGARGAELLAGDASRRGPGRAPRVLAIRAGSDLEGQATGVRIPERICHRSAVRHDRCAPSVEGSKLSEERRDGGRVDAKSRVRDRIRARDFLLVKPGECFIGHGPEVCHRIVLRDRRDVPRLGQRIAITDDRSRRPAPSAATEAAILRARVSGRFAPSIQVTKPFR